MNQCQNLQHYIRNEEKKRKIAENYYERFSFFYFYNRRAKIVDYLLTTQKITPGMGYQYRLLFIREEEFSDKSLQFQLNSVGNNENF